MKYWFWFIGQINFPWNNRKLDIFLKILDIYQPDKLFAFPEPRLTLADMQCTVNLGLWDH